MGLTVFSLIERISAGQPNYMSSISVGSSNFDPWRGISSIVPVYPDLRIECGPCGLATQLLPILNTNLTTVYLGVKFNWLTGLSIMIT